MKKSFIIICFLIAIISIIFEFYLMVTYANKPTSEIPFWVLFFLFNK